MLGFSGDSDAAFAQLGGVLRTSCHGSDSFRQDQEILGKESPSNPGRLIQPHLPLEDEHFGAGAGVHPSGHRAPPESRSLHFARCTSPTILGYDERDGGCGRKVIVNSRTKCSSPPAPLATQTRATDRFIADLRQLALGPHPEQHLQTTPRRPSNSQATPLAVF